MKKYISAIILTVCLMIALLPGAALAEETLPTEGSCGENLTWQLTEEGTLTISGDGTMEDYDFSDNRVPWNSRSVKKVIFEGKPTNIGDSAFSYCESLSSITIPKSVTTIGSYAFRDCESLSSIAIPGSVTAIGNSAFSRCKSLSSITIPESVTTIGYGAFDECYSLKSITIPGSVKTLANGMFSSCSALTDVTISEGVLSIENIFQPGLWSCDSLISITIPASVIRIDDGTFDYCNNLQAINVAQGNKVYFSVDGVLLDKDGGTLVRCPQGKTAYDIPKGIVSIKDNAFSDCSKLSSVTMPDTVTSIGNSAFYRCSKLSSITLPDTMTSIGSSAFAGCTSLRNVKLPSSVTTGDFLGIFSGCTALTAIAIPEGVTSLSRDFSGCSSLTDVSLPVSLKSIGPDTFKNCIDLKSVTYTGTETQWGAIQIATGNQELSLATMTYGGNDNPTSPEKPTEPGKPTEPDTPASPGTLAPAVTNGGLGKRVSVSIESGHWLTIQTRRGGSVAITSVQAPTSVAGKVSLTFSAAAGSVMQLWETEEEMTFTNGIPNNRILNTVIRNL